jgi:phenylacetate-CoA ligase
MTDLQEIISRKIFLPLSDRLRGVEAGRSGKYIQESQYYPEEQIREKQLQELKTLLQYVYKHNEFYRLQFQKINAFPDDFKTFSDFSRFPILNKDDIRNNLDKMISEQFSKSELLRRRTGGSTGVPIQVYQDKECQKIKEAIVRRHNSWAHFLPGKKIASLWGDIKPPSLKLRIYNTFIGRTIYLDTLKMDNAEMVDFLKRIRRTNTRLLFGHGHSIFFFAKFIKEKSIPFPKFEGIISTAETLPPEERQEVETVFGNIIFDRYGCEEIGLIASECQEHDGMHVAAEGVYAEILEGENNTPGRIVVTDLVNKGTPLIRYEIGDLATKKTGICRCGRGLPRIGKIVGRTSDIIYTPEGKMISGISLLDTFTIHVPGVRQVQIVQEKLDFIIFNVVKDNNFSEKSYKILTYSIPKYFGAAMKFQIVFVENIPLTGRGKFQYSICKINKKNN